jgi:hypothetical protein
MTELANWAARINAVGGKNRTQIFKAHEFKNKEIFDLLKRAEMQRAQKAQDLTVPNWTEQEFPPGRDPVVGVPNGGARQGYEGASSEG